MLRADNVWPLNRIAAEEDGEVESNYIVIAFPGVELDSKAPRVASKIWEFASKSDGAET